MGWPLKVEEIKVSIFVCHRMSELTFVIAQDVIDGRRSENFPKQGVKTIHDSYVSWHRSFPNSLVAHIARVIDEIGIWNKAS